MWIEREETIHGNIKNIHSYVEQLKEEYGEERININAMSSCYNGIETEVKVTYGFLVNTETFVQKYFSTKAIDKKGNTLTVWNNIVTTLCDIKKVIFNAPATIVFWEDGTKTVVKAEGEDYDPEKGLAMVIAKKAYGNQGNYYNEFKKWLPKES